MESAFPSQKFAKWPMCNIRQNGWRMTRGMQPERRVLPLESRSYNRSHPSPKAYCFSKAGDRKPFSSCWLLAWLPLIVLTYHSLPIKCAPWFTSIIEPYRGDSVTYYHFTLLVLVYRLLWGSTLHGVGPLSSRVVMISTVRLYIPPVLTSQRKSSSNAPMFDSAWKFLPHGGCRLNLEIWEGSCPFWTSARVVGPRRSNNEVQHKQSHEA
jgi:hypothetical protein